MADNNAKLIAAVRKAAKQAGAKPGTIITVTANNSDVDIAVDSQAVRV